jgi:protein-S-isoprenylcysteine O-methyltransferase Ste14
MHTPTPQSSSFDERQHRATMRDAVPAVVALVVSELVVASLDLDTETHPWHVAVALLPVIPAIWLIWVQWRVIGRADERQRSAHLEALGIGFTVAMLAALTGGLLDAADVGSSAQWLQITFIGGILAWIAALAVRVRS